MMPLSSAIQTGKSLSTMHPNEVVIKAVQKYGREHQITKAIEEMAELMNELAKSQDKRTTTERVIDEIADVKIMLKQLEYIYGQFNVEKRYMEKVKRLEVMLNE